MRIFSFIISIMAVWINVHAQSERYIALMDSADYYIAHDRWERAEETIKEALRLEPANFNNCLLLSNLGIIYSNQNRFDDAIDAFTLGLSIAPNSTVILNNRARAYLFSGKIEECLEDLNSSLNIDSLQEWPRQTRGSLVLEKGDFTTARDDFNFILNKNPQNAFALYGLGLVEEAEGNEDSAIKYYEQSLDIIDDEETEIAYISLLLNMENYSKASSNIRKCIEKYPDNPIFYLLRGCYHKLNFRNEEAEADKKIALSKGLDIETINQVFDNIGR